MTIQLQLPGDWPRNATWPDPVRPTAAEGSSRTSSTPSTEIRQVLDRYREEYGSKRARRTRPCGAMSMTCSATSSLKRRRRSRRGGGGGASAVPGVLRLVRRGRGQSLAFGKALAVICEVSAHQRTARMHLPPLQLAGACGSRSAFISTWMPRQLTHCCRTIFRSADANAARGAELGPRVTAVRLADWLCLLLRGALHHQKVSLLSSAPKNDVTFLQECARAVLVFLYGIVVTTVSG